MKQQLELINQFFGHQYRTYESGPTTYPDLRVEVRSTIGSADCNLTELINFMQKTAFRVENMRAARTRDCIEGDVWLAFAAYCQAIKKVEYNYDNYNSLFDRDPRLRQPNCKGRAKGFVQLLAVCGVPPEDLGLVRIGGGVEEMGKKIVQRDEETVNAQNVRVLVDAPAALSSPNAVTVSIQNNVLNVSRTTREPFANHYCAMVRFRGKYRFYDPLFHRVYVNGMKDYFLTYEERSDLNLSPNGPKCYADTDDDKNRLYSFQPNQVSRNFANSVALMEVQAAKGHLESNPSVYLIIDSKHWSNRKEEKILGHPWIVTQFFRDEPSA